MIRDIDFCAAVKLDYGIPWNVDQDVLKCLVTALAEAGSLAEGPFRELQIFRNRV